MGYHYHPEPARPGLSKGGQVICTSKKLTEYMSANALRQAQGDSCDALVSIVTLSLSKGERAIYE